MAHWFHRNPLKATTVQNFDLKYIAKTGSTQKICSEMRLKRNHLLDLLSDPNHSSQTLDKAVEEYLAILHGFLHAVDDKGGDSVLKDLINFKWTNSLLGQVPVVVLDVQFELCCMLINVALWYTKHASKLAGESETVSMDDAKEVHHCLRKAASYFAHVRDKEKGKIALEVEACSDFDTRILQAYVEQCTAEAQEVTVARAVELKHSPGLISSLAYETAKLYESADSALSTLDEKIVMKWRKYIQVKQAFYMCHAYSYHGDMLLSEDKCGEAIRCLQESVKYFDKSAALCVEYGKTKGPGTQAKPQEHLFFRRLGVYVKTTLDKCERENGFIYHHKVPVDPPALELKATYGLVSPEDITFPQPSPLWTNDAYTSFDITGALPPDLRKEGVKKGKDGKPETIPPVKEKDIPQSLKDPKNNSGCVIS